MLSTSYNKSESPIFFFVKAKVLRVRNHIGLSIECSDFVGHSGSQIPSAARFPLFWIVLFDAKCARRVPYRPRLCDCPDSGPAGYSVSDVDLAAHAETASPRAYY